MKKHCVANILLAIWEIFLYENNCSYNSFKFNKIRFYPLFVLFYKLKTKIRFSASWWSGNEKYFSFLFITRHGLLQSLAEFKWIYKGTLLHVISVHIIVSCINLQRNLNFLFKPRFFIDKVVSAKKLDLCWILFWHSNTYALWLGCVRHMPFSVAIFHSTIKAITFNF